MKPIVATLAAAACLLATSATVTASTVEYPSPVAVPHGLFLTLDKRGHPSFNPADGVDQLMSGKAGSTRLTQSVDWRAAPKAPGSRQAHHSRPAFPLPPGLSNNPACDRAQSPQLPWFCDVETDPAPQPPAPVPLPASVWILLAGLGAILAMKRRGTT